MLIGFGTAAHEDWIISKNIGTLPWCFYVAAIGVGMYTLLRVLEEKGWTRWFAPFRPAGMATLTVYLLPDVYYAVAEAVGLSSPAWLTGPLGLVKCAAFAFLVIGTAWALGKFGIKLNMRDFVYHAPTEVVFGKQSEEKVAGLVKKYGGHKVLVHYGGKSAQKSGLLDKICGLLRDGGVDFVCLGGVVPNPRLSLVHQGIDLCRQEGVDFILAIGGGSVIDSAKAIACGIPYDGEVWDFYLGKASPKCYLPVACVLTIPAAGSEMSESSVITNEDGDVKLGYSNQMSRPRLPA